MARATVFQKLRVYPEDTPGTKVPAFRQLMCTSAKLKPDVPRPTYRPTGFKAPTTSTAIKEMTNGDYEGVICYRDLVWLLSAFLESASVQTPGGGTNSREWTFEPQVGDPDDYITLTFETGSSDGAESAGFGLIQSMQLRVTKEEATIRGTLFAQELDEDITLTVTQNEIFSVTRGTHTGGDFTLTFNGFGPSAAINYNDNAAAVKSAVDGIGSLGTVTVTGDGSVGTPWLIEFTGTEAGTRVTGSADFSGLTGGAGASITDVQVGGTLTKVGELPVDPNSIGIFIADSEAGLSAGQLDKPLSWELNLGERFNQEFTVDDRQVSYTDVVEKGLEWTGRLVLEHDSYSVDLMDSMREKETLFMQIVMTGPVIESTIHNVIEITFPFRFVDTDRDDEDDVWGAQWDFEPIYDATADIFIRFRVVNDVTSIT